MGDDEVEGDEDGDTDEVGTKTPSVASVVVVSAGVSTTGLVVVPEDEWYQGGVADDEGGRVSGDVGLPVTGSGLLVTAIGTCVHAIKGK